MFKVHVGPRKFQPGDRVSYYHVPAGDPGGGYHVTGTVICVTPREHYEWPAGSYYVENCVVIFDDASKAEILGTKLIHEGEDAICE
jgi:hypothetical protein